MTEAFKLSEDTGYGSLKFPSDKRDIIMIGCVVTRFLDWIKSRNIKPTERMAKNLHMDLGACHCNGTPLNFDALMKMETTPFVIDIMGINKNLDRNTGKLLNGFRPRCAKSVLLVDPFNHFH